jgi:hypothetical protein
VVEWLRKIFSCWTRFLVEEPYELIKKYVFGDGSCNDSHKDSHCRLMNIGNSFQLYDMRSNDIKDENDNKNEGFNWEGLCHLSNLNLIKHLQ